MEEAPSCIHRAMRLKIVELKPDLEAESEDYLNR